MAYPKRTRDQHFKEDGPKRILGLDGGGLRGILTLGILNQIEDELRRRHGKEKEFRLCHYFDLIAGTSGAIIAATLAIGWSVEEITKKYFELGARVEKLEDDLLAGVPLLSYVRDNADLRSAQRAARRERGEHPPAREPQCDGLP